MNLFQFLYGAIGGFPEMRELSESLQFQFLYGAIGGTTSNSRNASFD